MGEAYIVSASRTAGGRRNGRLAAWHPADLAAKILDTLTEGFDPALVNDVVLGCVSQGGEQSQNIARNAVLASSLPESVPATTVDRQCGSSQQALHFAAQAVLSGTMDIVIAGGVESMTRVPMFSPSTLAEQAGLGRIKSAGMEKRYPDIIFSQFNGAENVARKYGLSKEAMDLYALDSHRKAAAAAQKFSSEIVPIDISLPDGSHARHVVDEGVRPNATVEAISGVKLIQEGVRLTAASASQICDGASGVLVVNANGLKAIGKPPLARIHHLSVTGGDPVIMLEAPIAATARALKKATLTIDGIDLFEVNEAFASIPMAWINATHADPARVNVNGGAISLGHPLGSSGTRLMTTLVHELGRRKLRYGLQTMCEGGGMANVTIVERL